MQPTSQELNVTLPSDTEIAFTRLFAAPRELVFKAFTDCAHLANWMIGPDGWTMHVCEMDLIPNGAYRWGWRKQTGETMEIRGIFRKVEPPNLVVSTEDWGDPWPESVNTMTFAEDEGGTLMSLTLLYPSKEARDAALQTGMSDGMSLSFARLDGLLAKEISS